MSISGNLEKLAEIKETFFKKFKAYEVDITEDTLFEDYPGLMNQFNLFSGVVKINTGSSISDYVIEEASKVVVNTSMTVSSNTSYEQYIEEEE